MKDYKLYLFDFDGCLVDTYYALEYVFKESFKPFNIEVTFEEVVKFCRQPLPVSFKEKGGKDEDFKEFNRLIDLYLKDRQTVTNSVLFPETIKFLNHLKSKGKKLGIVTSNNIPHVKEVLEYFKVDTNLFDVYVGNQESKIHKPNPDPILKALELLDYKYSKEETVYVGDAMDDVTAATRAGVDPILVDRNNEYPQYNGVKVENLMDIVFKKEDIKLLIVDIDWTILDHDTKDYDHLSIEALKKAQEKGIKICIATARPYESINAIELFKYITPDCLITCNGAAIFYNDELIHTQEIPPQVVRRICKEAVKHHLNVELNGPKTRYVVSKRMEKVIDLYKVFYDKLPQYQKYDGKPVITMMVVGPSKYDKYLTPYLRHGMYFRRFSEQGTDISASPVAKGPAIVWLLDYLNLTKDNAISFGDSDLDISSFENTTYSVCMGNAKDEIKKEATYVASSIKESGVADFIKKHLF